MKEPTFESLLRTHAQFIVEQTGPKNITILEPLTWKAPSIARPHCCYINTVIFYVCPYVVTRSGSLMEWDRVDTAVFVDQIVEYADKEYRIGCGRVIRFRSGWWMKHPACLRRNLL